MDFKKIRTQRRRKHAVIDGADVDLIEAYPHALPFYSLPPVGNLSLQEFECFAVDRLKVLKAVETVGYKHVRGSDDYNAAMSNELLTLRKQNVMRGIGKKNPENDELLEAEDLLERRKDHISHFILRLAYCRSEELRRWFIQQEMDLFRYRFLQESVNSTAKFLKLNSLDYKPISKEEKNSIYKELLDSSRKHQSHNVETKDYYRVPFNEALDLVKNRKVYLSRGYAYVPQNELVVIILTVFRSRLSHALAVTSRALPALEEDDRLLPMLNGLSKRYLGQDYGNKKPTGGLVTAGMIEGLSKKSFPPCMQNLHQGLTQNHHLRHWGRQQYGLFLKGIGVSMEEAIKFWKTEFCKAMDPDKFDKSHLYNIRHNFGKEGKRVNYTPYSCVKIITTNPPAPGDHHGCPFRHMDADILRQRLQSQGFPKDDTDKIMEHVKKGSYGFACGQYFAYKHQRYDMELNIMHPNQYYDESVSERKEDVETPKPNNRKVVRRPVVSQGAANSSVLSQSQTRNSTITDDFDDDMDTMMSQMEESDTTS